MVILLDSVRNRALELSEMMSRNFWDQYRFFPSSAYAVETNVFLRKLFPTGGLSPPVECHFTFKFLHHLTRIDFRLTSQAHFCTAPTNVDSFPSVLRVTPHRLIWGNVTAPLLLRSGKVQPRNGVDNSWLVWIQRMITFISSLRTLNSTQLQPNQWNIAFFE